MKKGLRMATALCGLMLAVPTVGYAAEVDLAAVNDPVRPTKEYRIELKLNEKTLTVNGEQKDLRVSAYISDNGYTMLPVREIAEVFPATKVGWEQDTKTAYVATKNYGSVQVGADEMLLNGKPVQLKEKAAVKDGRTFLAIRDVCRICDIADSGIEWDAETKTVTINATVEGFAPGER